MNGAPGDEDELEEYLRGQMRHPAFRAAYEQAEVVTGDAAQVPNPGSDEALSLGCRCAVLDNGHGRTPPYPPDGWWITQGCPVHAPPAR